MHFSMGTCMSPVASGGVYLKSIAVATGGQVEPPRPGKVCCCCGGRGVLPPPVCCCGAGGVDPSQPFCHCVLRRCQHALRSAL